MFSVPDHLSLLSLAWPAPFNSFSLEYLSAAKAAGLFLLLALPILWLGMRSLNGLGPVRKWVAIGIRLSVLLLIILILGGIRWQRRAKDLEVIILRDISESTSNVHDYPGQTLQSSIDNYIADIAAKDKPPDDRVGAIGFQDTAAIDAFPDTTLLMDAHPIREHGRGTDFANALKLALATTHSNAMHRFVLLWDGNSTQGDPDEAISVAIAQHIPIDVMPLRYNVQHEVLMDKLVAPTWKRENEPFSLTIYLKSTNTFPVTGELTVLHQGAPMDLDPATPGIQSRLSVKLSAAQDSSHPSMTPVIVRVPALQSRGVHQFHAFFEANDSQAAAGVSVTSSGKATSRSSGVADTLNSNNSADAYTFVQGKGQILYVDNVANGRGEVLLKALRDDGVEITPENHITTDQFPSSLIELENYDAIIMANVPYGPQGIGEEQQKNLANYVHEMGGGLVMIGGPDAFGAGGWQGKKLEQVLPLNMDIPAERQIPKGVLVLAMDSAEVPDGNYWSEQCAIKAMETLSAKDDVGIITWDWNKQGGACNWDMPLGPKGDGSKFTSAIKHWGLGDLPTFEAAIKLALDGDATSKGLLASDARQKHIIVITDDDPQMPSPATIDRCIKGKISVSTITVYPHQPHNVAPGIIELARRTGGRSFGPIEDHPDQLPQIFVKEATVVRRSLITENNEGIPLRRTDADSEIMKGLGDLPPVRGMVLTSRKTDPQIEIPIVAGSKSDPLLAHWQIGLGRVVAYTSDANTQWGALWVGSTEFSKFWTQVVRSVSRPPMSTLFDVTTTQSGGKGHILVEALDKQSGFKNFLNISGKIMGPNTSKEPVDAHLSQTGPGIYEGDFDAGDTGTYVVALGYNDASGQRGTLLSGVAVNDSPEMRDLQSNDAMLQRIADQTGGRILTPFSVPDANIFDRNGLAPAVTPLPIWDFLMPALLGLILVDVATRRIAWDWNALKHYASTSAATVRAFTTSRKIETRASLEALRKVRTEGSVRTFDAGGTSIVSQGMAAARPDPTAKFQASKTVEGDITTVVGGATKTAAPSLKPRADQTKSADQAGSMSSLLDAKRRARQKLDDAHNNDG